jgi:hypothetical protein
MPWDDSLLWNDAKRHLAMSAAPECTVTFPIENGMFGVDSLAKRLNVLVSDGQIGDWHPGRWIDWGHTAIQIGFDSVEDAALAEQLLCEVAIPKAVRNPKETNASEWRAPE